MKETNHIFRSKFVQLFLYRQHHSVKFLCLFTFAGVDHPQFKHFHQQIHYIFSTHRHPLLLVKIVKVANLGLDLNLVIYFKLYSCQIVLSVDRLIEIGHSQIETLIRLRLIEVRTCSLVFWELLLLVLSLSLSFGQIGQVHYFGSIIVPDDGVEKPQH